MRIWKDADCEDRVSRLAERSADLGSKRRGWFAVRTHPRCEMMAFDGLERMGFEPWMPLCRRHVRRRYTKSRRTVLRPVLTGYLFVRMPADKQGFTLAKSVNGVREVLGLKERGLKPLPGEEVERYRHFAESGVFDEARAKAHWRRNASHSGEVYAKGDSVRVKDGPYAGMKVVFGGYTGRQSARIMLELFGALRPVEIDPAALCGAN